jgi:hypothetical protein
MIAPNTFLLWWSALDQDGEQRFFVKLSAPHDAQIIDVHEGIEPFAPTTKH